MPDENTNEETQDETAEAAEPEVEATDAPEGVADVESLPVEQVPEGDSAGSAEEETAEPEASAEASEPEPESGEEPAEGPPAEVPDEPADAPVAEVEPEPESTEEPAEGAEEPAAEASAEEPAAKAPESTEEQAAEAPAAAPEKKKKKRLPRSERRQRSKPVRERPAERKPISRLPKPEHDRGRRQERQGTVVSASSDKTIVVRVDVVKPHPMYKKVVKHSTKLHAHDEENEAKVGDVVRLVETRPLSKLKRWRLQEVVEAAK